MKTLAAYSLLILTLLAFGVFAQDSTTLKGDWIGLLDAGAAKLKLILHFTANEDGTWRGTVVPADGPPDWFLAGATCEVVADAGHGIHRERPDEVRRLVKTFLG